MGGANGQRPSSIGRLAAAWPAERQTVDGFRLAAGCRRTTVSSSTLNRLECFFYFFSQVVVHFVPYFRLSSRIVHFLRISNFSEFSLGFIVCALSDYSRSCCVRDTVELISLLRGHGRIKKFFRTILSYVKFNFESNLTELFHLFAICLKNNRLK